MIKLYRRNHNNTAPLNPSDLEKITHGNDERLLKL
jgi:hypothetical protein